jgi:Secretion system C-terminal sorting domain
MKNPFLVILALAVALPVVSSAAGNYDCPGVVANGAVRSTNPYYSLTGAFGQNAVGQTRGDYICGAGFWQQSGGAYAGVPVALDPIPAKFWLGVSQPNPVRQSALLRFGLPKVSQVTIRVYDVRGREVGTLVDARLGPGYHSSTINGAGLASGVYFCRMDAERFSVTHKILVVK